MTRVTLGAYSFHMRAYKEWWPQRGCNTPTAKLLFDTKPRKAKDDLCGPCPVKRECLEYALLYKEHGIWGGTTETDRDQILSKAPQIQHRLKIEALQLGIFERRYTIDQYWESIREARKIATVREQRQANETAYYAARQTALEEFQALLAEWNIQ